VHSCPMPPQLLWFTLLHLSPQVTRATGQTLICTIRGGKLYLPALDRRGIQVCSCSSTSCGSSSSSSSCCYCSSSSSVNSSSTRSIGCTIAVVPRDVVVAVILVVLAVIPSQVRDGQKFRFRCGLVSRAYGGGYHLITSRVSSGDRVRRIERFLAEGKIKRARTKQQVPIRLHSLALTPSCATNPYTT
jgi:hypothetical protein